MTVSMKRTLWAGLGILVFIVGGALASPARITLHFPPRSEHPEAPDPERVARIRADIEMLAGTIGERNPGRAESLRAAETYVQQQLGAVAGLTVENWLIAGGSGAMNMSAARRHAEGRRTIVVGAHLDSAEGTPGADDNASGMAVLLELARTVPTEGSRSHVVFWVFENEEPPRFQTDEMGSRVVAQHYARRRDDPAAGLDFAGMFCLESVGHYSEEKGSQRWPLGLGAVLPRTANFVMLVANPASSRLLGSSLRAFRDASALPAAGASVPGAIPGVDWSDHAEFWREDFYALMVTDMPPFRNPNYHEPTDLPAAVDVDRVAMVADGMEGVLRRMLEE
jgi:hypothetical protein